MREVDLFILLLAAVVLLAMVAERRRVPHAVAFVLGGLVIGLLPFAPEVRISPDLIFLVFLPAILYPSAFRFAAEDFRFVARPVTLLAVGLVLATAAAVALTAHLVADLPWEVAFVLGAALGPTDPVAAVAIIRGLGAPERVGAILEGESLVNDGTGLSALQVALGVVGAASFALGSAVLEFLGVMAGGIAVGFAVGWLASVVRKRLDQPDVEIAISVLTAYGSFLAGDRLGVSGVLAAVVAGLVMGLRSPREVRPSTRMRALSFWQPLQFFAESMLFLLIGLQFADVLDTENAAGLGTLIAATLAVAAVTWGVRALWVFSTPYFAALPAALRSGNWRPRPVLSPRELVLVAGGGMRGAVSVAAVLSIPVAVGGKPFPDRATLLFVGFGAVVLTLVVPALGLAPLVRRLGLESPGGPDEEDVEARLKVLDAALRRADELADEGEVPQAALERAREEFEMRAAQLRDEIDRGSGEDPDAELHAAAKEIRRQLLGAERRALTEMAEAREVTGDTFRDMERDLDLEQARLED
jgi:CPA1 family monovalent cation:H+ antiporter